MTSENIPVDGGGRPTRRRMTGYQALNPIAGATIDTDPAKKIFPAAEAGQAPIISVHDASASDKQAPAGESVRPVRKTRMGGAVAIPAVSQAGARAVDTPVAKAALAANAPSETAATQPICPQLKTAQSPETPIADPTPGTRRRIGGTSSAAASPEPATGDGNRPAEDSRQSAASYDRQAAALTATGIGATAHSVPPFSASLGAVPTDTASAPASTKTARSHCSPRNQASKARPVWAKPVIVATGLLILAAVLIVGARWLRGLEPVQGFIESYSGHSSQPDSAPSGIPSWMGWQHFFNMFFIVLIIRTGLQVRTERKPPGYWTAEKGSFFSPKGNTPKKVSLTQWLHQSLDVLWVVNGLVFVILLITTGHWMRIVPTSWDIFPNMLSTGIQYASLDWPTENGWVHYNALQVTAYFITVFIAAPLAIISGIRMSTWWPEKSTRLNKIYPIEWARLVHLPVMLYFVLFTIAHVFLVFFTGILRNLNHMYTSRDVVDWWGLVIFLVSLLVVAAVWFLTCPLFITPIASRMGKVSKN